MALCLLEANAAFDVLHKVTISFEDIILCYADISRVVLGWKAIACIRLSNRLEKVCVIGVIQV